MGNEQIVIHQRFRETHQIFKLLAKTNRLLSEFLYSAKK